MIRQAQTVWRVLIMSRRGRAGAPFFVESDLLGRHVPGQERFGRRLCQSVARWYLSAVSTSSCSPQAAARNWMPVGKFACPKPFGTEIAGTPTRLLAPMGEDALMPGYAWSKVLLTG